MFTSSSVGLVLALALTAAVYIGYFYRTGDNKLYHFIEHLFIGVTVGYVVVIALRQVILPIIVPGLYPAIHGWTPLLLIPVLLGLILLAKPLSPRLAPFSDMVLAVVFGAGAALALTGALVGQVLPAISDTILPHSLGPGAAPTLSYWRQGPLGVFSGIIIVLGVSLTLLSFYFTAGPLPSRAASGRRAAITCPRGLGALLRPARWAGRWLTIAVFGFIFGHVALGRIALLIDRLQFVIQSIGHLAGR